MTFLSLSLSRFLFRADCFSSSHLTCERKIFRTRFQVHFKLRRSWYSFVVCQLLLLLQWNRKLAFARLQHLRLDQFFFVCHIFCRFSRQKERKILKQEEISYSELGKGNFCLMQTTSCSWHCWDKACSNVWNSLSLSLSCDNKIFITKGLNYTNNGNLVYWIYLRNLSRSFVAWHSLCTRELFCITIWISISLTFAK